MAFTVMELIAKLKTDQTEFNKGLKTADAKGKESATKAAKFGKAISVAYKVVAAAGVAVFVKALVSAASKAEDAFQIQEAAVTKLNAALETTGQYSEDVSNDLQAFASEMQGLTTVGDETSIMLEQVAINSGLTADQAKQATQDAIGLSKAFGIDVTAAIKATTNAQQGNFDMLNRYIPAVKNATGETEKTAIAQRALADAFEIAKAEAQTSIGVEIQLQNALGDSQEIVGSYVANALTPWRKALLEIVTNMNTLKAAQMASDAGTATTAQKLTVAQQELLELEGALIRSRVTGYGISRKARAELEARIASEEALVLGLQYRMLNEKRMGDVVEEETLRAASLAADDAERKAELAEAELARLEEHEAAKLEVDANSLAVRETLAEEAANREQEANALAIQNFQDKNAKILASDQALAEAEILLDQQKLDAKTAFFSGFSALLTQAGKENKAAAIAGKVLASAQAGINTALAFTKTLADGGPFPLNVIAATGIAASGIAQQIAIANTPIPSFQEGGIVPGTSYSGDNVQANVNSGEAVLNASQQKRFMDIANGSGGTGDVYVYIGSEQISAKVVRDVNSGKAGVISSRVIS